LASTTTPGSSARRPAVDVEENLLPAAGLLELMSEHPLQRVVFVSSGGAVYGSPHQVPVAESHSPQSLSYHAAGKLALEAMFGVFAQANSVPLVVLRPSNLYGPGQTLRNGFGLVRTVLENAFRGRPTEIWGDGSAVRDYLFIDDAVEACLSLLRSRSPDGVFNVGSGSGTSIREMIALVEHITGRKLPVTDRPARSTDVRDIVLDSGRLTSATGWTPTTTLEQGLRRTWDWVRKAAQ
jgi:UDP-glucose 4-epimerase